MKSPSSSTTRTIASCWSMSRCCRCGNRWRRDPCRARDCRGRHQRTSRRVSRVRGAARRRRPARGDRRSDERAAAAMCYTTGTTPVVIISETLARTTWPGEEAIGKHVKVPEIHDWLTVVGVVGNTKHRIVERAVPTTVVSRSLPAADDLHEPGVARTNVPPLSAYERGAPCGVDGGQGSADVVDHPAPILWWAGTRTARPVFWRCCSLFSPGLCFLLLASVGIYGVMSYAATERTHEIGIRMALGASATRVMGEIVRRGLALTGSGTARRRPRRDRPRPPGAWRPVRRAAGRGRHDACRRCSALLGGCVGRRLLRAGTARITRGSGRRAGRGIGIWLISWSMPPTTPYSNELGEP